ncbi:lytic transglycosylase domain-containing protein [Rhodoferax sp. GW822-FHT02A01]|uniref:lytic transglycosylase domain-containing protein n=1 Tax=Rhodoferax sp. GW822-FHT02A01 TaxID=3141537 RepID=UPI00315D37D3
MLRFFATLLPKVPKRKCGESPLSPPIANKHLTRQCQQLTHAENHRYLAMNFKFAIFLLTALLSWTASAGSTNLCSWEGAAQRYGVNSQVLYAIAAQESGLNPNAVHVNADGSQDVGLTQINTKWLPHLSKFGITSENLLNPCINMHVGAYILSLHMIRHGNTWQAVGAFHSNTPWRRDQYAQSIYQRIQFQVKPGSAHGS